MGLCRFSLLLSITGLAVLVPSASLAAVSTDPTPDQIQSIIRKFTDKETEFAKARENYTYQQTNKIVELTPDGQPEGQYEMLEEISFDDRDRRMERVLRAPVSTLEKIIMTPEDEQDMRNVMPFVMTNDTLDQYTVNYIGREKVDEISCYVFSVKPKQLTKDRKRYFEGEIWVDDQDLQIVKTFGRSTGALRKHEDQQFPKFETYREQIDGKYWFPTYTYADDTLNFGAGPQRIKEIIKYNHYKKWEFKSSSTITFGAPGKTTDGKAPAPTAPAPPLAPHQ